MIQQRQCYRATTPLLCDRDHTRPDHDSSSTGQGEGSMSDEYVISQNVSKIPSLVQNRTQKKYTCQSPLYLQKSDEDLSSGEDYSSSGSTLSESYEETGADGSGYTTGTSYFARESSAVSGIDRFTSGTMSQRDDNSTHTRSQSQYTSNCTSRTAESTYITTSYEGQYDTTVTSHEEAEERAEDVQTVSQEETGATPATNSIAHTTISTRDFNNQRYMFTARSPFLLQAAASDQINKINDVINNIQIGFCERKKFKSVDTLLFNYDDITVRENIEDEIRALEEISLQPQHHQTQQTTDQDHHATETEPTNVQVQAYQSASGHTYLNKSYEVDDNQPADETLDTKSHQTIDSVKDMNTQANEAMQEIAELEHMLDIAATQGQLTPEMQHHRVLDNRLDKSESIIQNQYSSTLSSHQSSDRSSVRQRKKYDKRPAWRKTKKKQCKGCLPDSDEDLNEDDISRISTAGSMLHRQKYNDNIGTQDSSIKKCRNTRRSARVIETDSSCESAIDSIIERDSQNQIDAQQTTPPSQAVLPEPTTPDRSTSMKSLIMRESLHKVTFKDDPPDVLGILPDPLCCRGDQLRRKSNSARRIGEPDLNMSYPPVHECPIDILSSFTLQPNLRGNRRMVTSTPHQPNPLVKHTHSSDVSHASDLPQTPPVTPIAKTGIGKITSVTCAGSTISQGVDQDSEETDCSSVIKPGLTRKIIGKLSQTAEIENVVQAEPNQSQCVEVDSEIQYKENIKKEKIKKTKLSGKNERTKLKEKKAGRQLKVTEPRTARRRRSCRTQKLMKSKSVSDHEAERNSILRDDQALQPIEAVEAEQDPPAKCAEVDRNLSNGSLSVCHERVVLDLSTRVQQKPKTLQEKVEFVTEFRKAEQKNGKISEPILKTTKGKSKVEKKHAPINETAPRRRSVRLQRKLNNSTEEIAQSSNHPAAPGMKSTSFYDNLPDLTIESPPLFQIKPTKVLSTDSECEGHSVIRQKSPMEDLTKFVPVETTTQKVKRFFASVRESSEPESDKSVNVSRVDMGEPLEVGSLTPTERSSKDNSVKENKNEKVVVDEPTSMIPDQNQQDESSKVSRTESLKQFVTPARINDMNRSAISRRTRSRTKSSPLLVTTYNGSSIKVMKKIQQKLNCSNSQTIEDSPGKEKRGRRKSHPKKCKALDVSAEDACTSLLINENGPVKTASAVAEIEPTASMKDTNDGSQTRDHERNEIDETIHVSIQNQTDVDHVNLNCHSILSSQGSSDQKFQLGVSQKRLPPSRDQSLCESFHEEILQRSITEELPPLDVSEAPEARSPIKMEQSEHLGAVHEARESTEISLMKTESLSSEPSIPCTSNPSNNWEVIQRESCHEKEQILDSREEANSLSDVEEIPRDDDTDHQTTPITNIDQAECEPHSDHGSQPEEIPETSDSNSVSFQCRHAPLNVTYTVSKPRVKFADQVPVAQSPRLATLTPKTRGMSLLALFDSSFEVSITTNPTPRKSILKKRLSTGPEPKQGEAVPRSSPVHDPIIEDVPQITSKDVASPILCPQADVQTQVETEPKLVDARHENTEMKRSVTIDLREVVAKETESKYSSGKKNRRLKKYTDPDRQKMYGFDNADSGIMDDFDEKLRHYLLDTSLQKSPQTPNMPRQTGNNLSGKKFFSTTSEERKSRIKPVIIGLGGKLVKSPYTQGKKSGGKNKRVCMNLNWKKKSLNKSSINRRNSAPSRLTQSNHRSLSDPYAMSDVSYDIDRDQLRASCFKHTDRSNGNILQTVNLRISDRIIHTDSDSLLSVSSLSSEGELTDDALTACKHLKPKRQRLSRAPLAKRLMILPTLKKASQLNPTQPPCVLDISSPTSDHKVDQQLENENRSNKSLTIDPPVTEGFPKHKDKFSFDSDSEKEAVVELTNNKPTPVSDRLPKPESANKKSGNTMKYVTKKDGSGQKPRTNTPTGKNMPARSQPKKTSEKWKNGRKQSIAGIDAVVDTALVKTVVDNKTSRGNEIRTAVENTPAKTLSEPHTAEKIGSYRKLYTRNEIRKFGSEDDLSQSSLSQSQSYIPPTKLRRKSVKGKRALSMPNNAVIQNFLQYI